MEEYVNRDDEDHNRDKYMTNKLDSITCHLLLSPVEKKYNFLCINYRGFGVGDICELDKDPNKLFKVLVCRVTCK